MLLGGSAAAAEPVQGGPDPARVKQIAAMLAPKPFAFGPKIDDRAAWEKLAVVPAMAGLVRDAERRLQAPVPQMSEDVYLEYKRTGQRTRHYGEVRHARHERITLYALAECIENKGRFIKPLEQAIAEVCSEPTWVDNYHDASLENWNGKIISIDLGAVGPPHAMAQAMVLMGERMSEQSRALIVTTVRQRTLDVYREVALGNRPPRLAWWMTSLANWNAVCHYGVIAAALGVIEDRNERAWYVAAAEKYLENYLRGFGPDGYCDEGMGYWSYGFGNYVPLCELIYQASDGKLNWYDNDAVRLVAAYPLRLHIGNGVWPAFADCRANPRPSEGLLAFLGQRYGTSFIDWRSEESAELNGPGWALIRAHPSMAATVAPNRAAWAGEELRTYLDHGGVLVCRPRNDAAARLGLALKGGHNGESHNHNDLGSYVVTVRDRAVLLDPGAEVYTARTFGKDRYQSKLLNSYGHPVPLVAGKLQSAGARFRAAVLSKEFTDVTDTFGLDLSGGYEVPQLRKLVRTFVYQRGGAGALSVRDEFAFDVPQAFGTALITYGKWHRLADDELVVDQDGRALRVKIAVDRGAAVKIADEVIDEQTHSGEKPTRIGIDLAKPAAAGAISLLITPADGDK